MTDGEWAPRVISRCGNTQVDDEEEHQDYSHCNLSVVYLSVMEKLFGDYLALDDSKHPVPSSIQGISFIFMQGSLRNNSWEVTF
jgi:hypothetical protein